MKVTFSDIITILTKLIAVNESEQLVKKQLDTDSGFYEMEFYVSGKDVKVSWIPNAIIEENSLHLHSFVRVELEIDSFLIGTVSIDTSTEVWSLMTLYSLASVSIPVTATRRKEALELCVKLAK